MIPYCSHCGGQHDPITSLCGTWYYTGLGYSVIVPTPKKIITKTMPCGHLGVLVKDKWVCQTCMIGREEGSYAYK